MTWDLDYSNQNRYKCLISTFGFLFTGNKLICDCRISWVQTLRNETRSEPLRQALEDVTCYPNVPTNPTPIDNTNDVISQAIDEVPPKPDQIFEIKTKDVVSPNEEYDEAQMKYEPTVQPATVNQLSVVDVPLESMPCPSELVQKGEDSLMLSSKDESYWHSSSSFQINSDVFVILTLLVIIL